MLTGNTPWRAKNEKELVKKIEGEQIEEILLKQKFSNVAKEFLKQSLCQEKGQRLGP
jgi:pyruvate/oxaloacetate carboxyltransferase